MTPKFLNLQSYSTFITNFSVLFFLQIKALSKVVDIANKTESTTVSVNASTSVSVTIKNKGNTPSIQKSKSMLWWYIF